VRSGGSPRTLRAWIEAGVFPKGRRIGNKQFWSYADLILWLKGDEDQR
jgi:DNA-binding transcriptional MerR regulator